MVWKEKVCATLYQILSKYINHHEGIEQISLNMVRLIHERLIGNRLCLGELIYDQGGRLGEDTLSSQRQEGNQSDVQDVTWGAETVILRRENNTINILPTKRKKIKCCEAATEIIVPKVRVSVKWEKIYIYRERMRAEKKKKKKNFACHSTTTRNKSVLFRDLIFFFLLQQNSHIFEHLFLMCFLTGSRLLKHVHNDALSTTPASDVHYTYD